MTLKTLLPAFFLLGVLLGNAQDFTAVSYNIKYDNVNDTVNNWEQRKEAMIKLVQHHAPHFLGMQEVLHRQLEYLKAHLPGYDHLGVGRDDGKEKGEYSPILFNSSAFALLQGSTFWLSPTPETISVGWDAAMERICTYGLFQHRESGKKLWVFNTHFDHVGVKAREASAQLIADKITELNTEGHPVILMGDLNLTPDTAPIQFLKGALTDAQKVSKQPFYGPRGTFSGFDHDRVLDKRIDYIFTERLGVESYMHIDDRMENNKHISDHLPVLAHLSFL
ncbi:endonuclease/exonuclease/phosphatase family protein [Maribacter sp. 2307ULW6-5]|uniref:endonuclease/exonuclease/phosphatase family protein n=1 Tax=Maribacter sp. 2307ULW6-5 TaxID=3386275 RepID=UPI0039BD29C6